MCDHDMLIEKYEELREVHRKFLQLFNNIVETALCMQSMVSDVNTGYDDILKLLKAQAEPLPPVQPQKRRKAHSFDSPSTVARKEDSPAQRNRSDPEVSASILDQNINLPDSEDSFFALTQSPSREPLSPKGSTSNDGDNVPRTPPKRDSWLKTDFFSEHEDDSKAAGGEVGKRKKKGALSLSRFSSSFKMSPETSKQAELLPIRPKLVTPKPKGISEQENVAPPSSGKWTAKKSTPGRIDYSGRKTPTSSTKNDNSSLLNRTRLRQTKLRFPDSLNKSMADEDETYFDEFVVPSPTSTTVLNATRFLKSAKKKEQSSFIASHNATRSATKSDVETAKGKVSPENDDDDFDIDQTYFSEAEKDLHRSKTFARPSVPSPSTRVKVEPLTQKKPKAPILAEETQPDQDSGSGSVLYVKPVLQDEIITIDETQPSKKDLFMEAIREQRRKEENSRLSVLNVMGPPAKRDIKQDSLFPVKSDLSSMLKKPTVPSYTKTNERQCTDCTKQRQFLLNQGMPPEVIRGKLPRNCRECRLAQLHETPPGFWNPEFTPTQI